MKVIVVAMMVIKVNMTMMTTMIKLVTVIMISDVDQRYPNAISPQDDLSIQLLLSIEEAICAFFVLDF